MEFDICARCGDSLPEDELELVEVLEWGGEMGERLFREVLICAQCRLAQAAGVRGHQRKED